MSQVPPVFDGIVGQEAAVTFLAASLEHPVHAYLFLGPVGTGRTQAAACFAAGLFCPRGGCGSCEICRETLARRHPDLRVVERLGAAVLAAQAAEIVRIASLSPRAAPYQVLVLADFHLIGSAAPRLLKTIEEPPDTTIIIVTAESVPADFTTIASRCSVVEFRRLSESEVAAALVAEGAEPGRAEVAARVSGGRLDQARLLLEDEGLGARMERWRQLPAELNGTGAKAAELAQLLVAGASEPVSVVEARQQAEYAALLAEAKASGERSLPGRAELEARYKREQRRARTDDLRAGLATLAAFYRGRLGAESQTAIAAIAALEAINEASARLQLNVDSTLLLEWLLIQLDRSG